MIDTVTQPTYAEELRKHGFIQGNMVNSGTYGTVYELRTKDKLTHYHPPYALKLIEPTPFGMQRLEEKGLELQDLVTSEFLPPDHQYLIPRTIVQLGKDTQGILMPFYPTFADTVFGKRWKDTAGRHQSTKPTPSDILHFIADVAAGANEFYELRNKRAHSDIKLENIAKSERGGETRYLLGDFGSSQYADWPMPGRSGSRVGDPTIRAPELFTNQPDVHPTRQSDAWSIGATLFYVTTGRELWESHFSYDRPVAQIGSDLESFYKLPSIATELEARIKTVPKYARKLVKELLVLEPMKRTIADATLVERVRKLARRYDPRTNTLDILVSYGKFMAAGAVASVVLAAVSPWVMHSFAYSDTGESKPTYIVNGKTAVINPNTKAMEEFSYERPLITGKGLSEAMNPSYGHFLKDDAYSTFIAPNDESYRILWGAVQFAANAARYGIMTPMVKHEMSQEKHHRVSEVYDALGRRLKIALDNQRKRTPGKIDVEDTIIDMFYGEERLREAQEKGGPLFTSYSLAMRGVNDKDMPKLVNEGRRIIPEETDLFIARAVDYINLQFVTRNRLLAEKFIGPEKINNKLY